MLRKTFELQDSIMILSPRIWQVCRKKMTKDWALGSNINRWKNEKWLMKISTASTARGVYTEPPHSEVYNNNRQARIFATTETATMKVHLPFNREMWGIETRCLLQLSHLQNCQQMWGVHLEVWTQCRGIKIRRVCRAVEPPYQIQKMKG